MTDRYTYHIFWSDEDDEFVALCHEFPLLSWLEPTADAAFAGIRRLVADILEDMQTTGETPPTPLADLVIPDEHYPLEFVVVGLPNIWSETAPPALPLPKSTPISPSRKPKPPTGTSTPGPGRMERSSPGKSDRVIAYTRQSELSGACPGAGYIR